MQISQRSYSGHTFRPRPVIEIEKTSNTLIVATAWGNQEMAQWTADFIKERLSASGEVDAEITKVVTKRAPVEESNKLRDVVQLANQQLYKKANEKEYQTAVEIAVVNVERKVLSWVQYGNPHLLLATGQGFQPLSYTPDWSWQLQQSSPLVANALGIKDSLYPNCGSYRLQGNESLFLVARSALPAKLFSVAEPELTNCAEALVEDNADAPFWLGMLSLS